MPCSEVPFHHQAAIDLNCIEVVGGVSFRSNGVLIRLGIVRSREDSAALKSYLCRRFKRRILDCDEEHLV